MNKVIKKASAIFLSAVMAASLAVSVSAATTASCPPHNPIRDAGTKTYSYSWSHSFTLTNPNGDIFTETCTKTENRYQYNRRCTKCGVITETEYKVEFTHSNPRCPER